LKNATSVAFLFMQSSDRMGLEVPQGAKDLEASWGSKALGFDLSPLCTPIPFVWMSWGHLSVGRWLSAALTATGLCLCPSLQGCPKAKGHKQG
jgi:hypothetical protein